MVPSMLKRIVPIVLIAAGCSSVAEAQTYHNYQCTDGSHFEVAFYPQTKAAYLQIDGKSLVLPKRFSLISQRFKQGGYSFAMRSGGKAIMKHGGKTSDCEVKQ
jgi:membrane-bound inhibitor of C-type lysozyme